MTKCIKSDKENRDGLINSHHLLSAAGHKDLIVSYLFFSVLLFGLSCCHSLSPSLSAALLVSIIHHLSSLAIYTSFYSQSVVPLRWLHLSTLIRIFQPVYAVLSCRWGSGPGRRRHTFPCTVENHLAPWKPLVRSIVKGCGYLSSGGVRMTITTSHGNDKNTDFSWKTTAFVNFHIHFKFLHCYYRHLQFCCTTAAYSWHF